MVRITALFLICLTFVRHACSLDGFLRGSSNRRKVLFRAEVDVGEFDFELKISAANGCVIPDKNKMAADMLTELNNAFKGTDVEFFNVNEGVAGRRAEEVQRRLGGSYYYYGSGCSRCGGDSDDRRELVLKTFDDEALEQEMDKVIVTLLSEITCFKNDKEKSIMTKIKRK